MKQTKHPTATKKLPTEIASAMHAAKKAADARKPVSCGHLPMSLTRAAAEVLEFTKQPMTCRQILDAIAINRSWRTDAATPEATLHAALTRDIAKNGRLSRFTKAGRGLFAAR